MRKAGVGTFSDVVSGFLRDLISVGLSVHVEKAHYKPVTQKGNVEDFPLGSWLLGLHAEKEKRRHLTKQFDPAGRQAPAR